MLGSLRVEPLVLRNNVTNKVSLITFALQIVVKRAEVEGLIQELVKGGFSVMLLVRRGATVSWLRSAICCPSS